MTNIMIDATEVSEYLVANEESLVASMHEIANDSTSGIQIFITKMNGSPEIIVTEDYDEVYIDDISEKAEECEELVQSIYDEYLSGEYIKEKLDSAISEKIDEDELRKLEIKTRESDLDDALYDFCIGAVCENCSGLNSSEEKKMLEDVKEHMLQYIALKWGIDIYRPMYIEDSETGEEFYEEFPYSCLEFEDADNPVYKPITTEDKPTK